jgi:hypothetical protein
MWNVQTALRGFAAVSSSVSWAPFAATSSLRAVNPIEPTRVLYGRLLHCVLPGQLLSVRGDAYLGVAGALEHAAGAVAQREDVSRALQVGHLQ